MATAGVVAKLRCFDLLLESDGAGRSPTGGAPALRRVGFVGSATTRARDARPLRDVDEDARRVERRRACLPDDVRARV